MNVPIFGLVNAFNGYCSAGFYSTSATSCELCIVNCVQCQGGSTIEKCTLCSGLFQPFLDSTASTCKCSTAKPYLLRKSDISYECDTETVAASDWSTVSIGGINAITVDNLKKIEKAALAATTSANLKAVADKISFFKTDAAKVDNVGNYLFQK